MSTNTYTSTRAAHTRGSVAKGHRNTTNPIQLIHESTTAFLNSLRDPESKEELSIANDTKEQNQSVSPQIFHSKPYVRHISTPETALTTLTNHLAAQVWKKLENPASRIMESAVDLVSNDGFVESLFIEWDDVENDEMVEGALLARDQTNTSVNSTNTTTTTHDSSTLSATAQQEQHSDDQDRELHFRDVENQPRLTAQYILVLSALNFCFWPSIVVQEQSEDPSADEASSGDDDSSPALDSSSSFIHHKQVLDYPDLARALKRIAERQPNTFSAINLARITEDDLTEWLGTPHVPLLSERVRLLNEVGVILDRYFDGEAAVLIEKAHKSAASLVSLITSYFPGFRDHCISPVDGRQVFLYKRAQIFVADIWGAFSGKGIGEFHDINQLTMFADYQVPQVLRHLGLLVYDEHLSKIVDNQMIIPAGSVEELEIRACTIRIVEDIRRILAQKHRIRCKSIEIDWYLWQQGESLKRKSTSLLPHHRTLTIYY